ncbi:quercetin 2,3-dioxygenase [Saccharopolyspora indica]|uniref:quercetin 2,3-dioxygenase n=1 Tax=Saccharopolyspora indica TaxID=1229659 RepID=UPI0022EACB64|nr:quercetin 2,3-dioxygenase [Saccharopolyspora indica]MDA3644094.1 quercetin 2,3-dioxygenase [Saccharopolyspora indica]
MTSNEAEPRKGLLHVPADEGESVWIGADIYTMKATGENTGGSLSLMEVSVPPGDGPPPHIHSNEDEGIYVLAGDLEFFSGDQTFKAGPGDFIFIPRGTVHSLRNIGVHPGKTLTMYTPGGMDRYFAGVGDQARPGVPPQPMSEEQLHRAMTLAPEHGLEVQLPPPGEPA